MNKVKITLGALAVIMAACTPSKQVEEPTLKDVFKDKFLIGTAMNTWQVAGIDTQAQDVVKKHFSAIVAENCMKIEEIWMCLAWVKTSGLMSLSAITSIAPW